MDELKKERLLGVMAGIVISICIGFLIWLRGV